MIMQLEDRKTYTPEEYLDFEINAETRHEYIHGEIIPMTGGTPEHNEIASILNAALRIALKGKPYSIFVADQRLWIPDRQLYTYPDVMVVPRPLQRQPGRTDTLTNPVAIAEVLSKSTKNYDRAEVLSKSTKNYDRDEKFAAYRTIPSFQEYLLIDQYIPHVEHYSKTGDRRWIFTEYNDLDSSISLAAIPFEIPLADLYEGVAWES